VRREPRAGEQDIHPFALEVLDHTRAGYPLLYVVTPEEERAISLIHGALRRPGPHHRELFIWSIARGLCTPDMRPVSGPLLDAAGVLRHLLQVPTPGVFILEDFHSFLDSRSRDSALYIRMLRDLVIPFKQSHKTVVILSAVLSLPPELEKDMVVLDLEPPDAAELLAVLEDTVTQVRNNPLVAINLEAGGREKMVKALTGLTHLEAENALAKMLVTTSRIDPEDTALLAAEKEQIIRKSGILEFYSSPERFENIGGLDNLKLWLRERERGFTEAARLFGLPTPKGILLVGIPGCGKSLAAKVVGAEWRMPLLKFDLGKVFASLVGQAEENMRRALKMAEALAPCVLWIDEIEKGLAGASGGSGDSGVAARIFGALLTWMEENRKPVFVIATANNIDGIPPELLRKGRFDEVFFINLPTADERRSIFAIHLAKHQRDFREFDIAALADVTDRFSGAEIEQVVISGMYAAFAEGANTKVQNHHLMRATADTKPLADTMQAQIGRMLDAAGRWRSAAGDVVVQAAPEPAKPSRRVYEM
jgi:AAA+ superfamily predicted ATPase